MPYFVKPDGSIGCDTPEEAIALQQQILAQQVAQNALSPVSLQRPGITPSPIQNAVDVFLKSFVPYVGMKLSGEDMVRVLGVKGVTGVGTKLRHVSDMFEKESLDLSKFISTTRENGATYWNVHKASVEKS